MESADKNLSYKIKRENFTSIFFHFAPVDDSLSSKLKQNYPLQQIDIQFFLLFVVQISRVLTATEPLQGES